MIIYAAFAAVFLLLPILGFWPIIVRGNRNSNSPYHIILRAPDHPMFQRQSYRGVRAQEVIEYWLRWVPAILTGAVILPFLPAGVPILIALFATMWVRIPALLRQLEYIGHAAEVEVAEREGFPDYLRAEAERMWSAYDGLFQHLTVSEIAAKVNARRPIARVLLFLLQRRIGHA